MMLGIDIPPAPKIEEKRRAVIAALTMLAYEIGDKDDPQVEEFLRQPVLRVVVGAPDAIKLGKCPK